MSYWCGAEVAYSFCNDGVGSDCTFDKGMSGAGTNRNKSVFHKPDWLFGGGYSSMKFGPYDAGARGAVILYGLTDCT